MAQHKGRQNEFGLALCRVQNAATSGLRMKAGSLTCRIPFSKRLQRLIAGTHSRVVPSRLAPVGRRPRWRPVRASRLARDIANRFFAAAAFDAGRIRHPAALSSPSPTPPTPHAPSQTPKRVQQTCVARLTCTRITKLATWKWFRKPIAVPCNKLQHRKCEIVREMGIS